MLPPEAKELEKELKEIVQQKDAAIRDHDFEKAGELRDEEQAIRDKIRELTLAWKEEKGQTQELVVTEENIAEVVAGWTKIPVSKLTEGETERLLKMEDVLHERIIGQQEAVTAISKAIRRTRAGLKNPKRPIGAFIFSGPSGVGKTELAKVLSEFYFGSEEALIRVDMSEFMERHSVSKLIGSPPGYVGHQDGGQLTEQVRRKPYSVILFDEIEKAHPDTFNVLLQIMEDGRLSDSRGRVVDFKNTILILTSNIGARAIAKGGGGLGFTTSDKNEADERQERIRDKVLDELKQNFRPEFLNRVSDIVVFHQLSREEIKEIVDIMMIEVDARLKDAEIEMTFDESIKDMLAKEGYDEKMGARPLRRAISRLIEDPLSEELLLGKIPTNTPLVLRAREDNTIYFEKVDSDAADSDESEKEAVEA